MTTDFTEQFLRIGRISCRSAVVPSVIPRSAAADKKIYIAPDVCALECSRILHLNGVAGYGFRAQPGPPLPYCNQLAFADAMIQSDRVE
jgi:hypothetical protein